MEQETSRTSKPKVIRRIEVYFDSVDEDDFQANIQHIKDNVKNVVDYSANTIEYYPAGHLVITPHYLKSIPTEVVSLIVNYLIKQQPPYLKQKDLYQCALINKQFYRIANPLLWHTPTISNAKVLAQLTSSLVMDKFEDLGDELQRLDIQGPYWNDVDFSFMLPFIRSLDILTIGNNATNITCASLKHVPQCCPHLTCMNLIHTPMTDTFVDAMQQHCYQLRQIGLTTEDLPIDTFERLAECPLETISLYCHSNNTDIYRSMIYDMKTFDQLTYLSVHGPGVQSFLNIIFSTNDVAWPRLARLHIAGQNNITENAFISFIKSHRHLKYLVLQIKLSDTALHAIAAHLPLLTKLQLQGNVKITRRGVYHLVRHCNHLKQVNFINCQRIVSAMPEFADPRSNGVTLDAEKIKQIRQSSTIVH